MRRMLHAWSMLLVIAALGCAGDKVSERESSPKKPSSSKGKNDSSGSAGASSDFGNTATQTMEAPKIQPGLDNHTCARADVYVERIRPRVVFLVDASSSMSEDLGG